jgi:hypothetical protein
MRLIDSRARSTPNPMAGSDGAPDGGMDCKAAYRGLRLGPGAEIHHPRSRDVAAGVSVLPLWAKLLIYIFINGARVADIQPRFFTRASCGRRGHTRRWATLIPRIRSQSPFRQNRFFSGGLSRAEDGPRAAIRRFGRDPMRSIRMRCLARSAASSSSPGQNEDVIEGDLERSPAPYPSAEGLPRRRHRT